MDARLPKRAPKPKPPAQKRAVLPALTKTQLRPLRCDGVLVSGPAELVRYSAPHGHITCIISYETPHFTVAYVYIVHPHRRSR